MFRAAGQAPGPGPGGETGSMLSLTVRLGLGAFELEVDRRVPLEGICALLGPSGSGKTTLLRIVAGLEQRAHGRIAFGDELWQDHGGAGFVPAHRRGVGYVFQEARLFPHLSVAGNLRYAERRARALASRIAREDVIAALDLGDLMPRRALSLSGGERQRVAIARALLTRPRLLLMDEPLASLDARRRGEILPYIARLPEAFGVPVLYVTHAVEEAARLASRVLVLSAGRAVAGGPLAEVLESLDFEPFGRFEASVVFTARVVGHDAEYGLTLLSHHGRRIVMPRAAVEAGREVRLRVRARDVALATRRPEGISVRNVIEGRVAGVREERYSAVAEVLVDIGGARLRARITRQAVAELALRPGSRVYALIKAIAFDRRALAVPPVSGTEQECPEGERSSSPEHGM